MTTTEKICR